MSSNENYFKELSKLSRLSEEQIRAEARLLKLGDLQALDKIVNANLRLVVHIAKRYQKAIEKVEIFELNDLISEGNYGLVQAAKKYDPDRGVNFGYYASFSIQSKIIDFIINHQSTIRSPYNKMKTDSKIRKVVNELFQKLNTEIGAEQLKDLGIFTDDEIKHFFEKTEVVPYENYYDSEEEIEDLEFQATQFAMMKNALKFLKPNERFVIKKFFGIDCERMTLLQIAKERGVTKSRIGQIKKIALEKLNQLMKNK